MSLATNIKEFADVLHNIYAQQLSSIAGTDLSSDSVISLSLPKIEVIRQASIYLVKSFGSLFFYFLTFQWLRDFSYLPLLSPEYEKASSIVTDTFLAEPGSYLFSFSKNGVSLLSSALQGTDLELHQKPPFFFFLRGDSLLAGFVNSFFFSLPFSLPHLITLRRMFSQGIAAATASILGTVAAHTLLLVGVLYGIRFLVIPFYSFEPATFLIGTVTIAIVISEFVKEKRLYLVPLTAYPSLIRIAVLAFILAFCESATVFHDLHHLTLNKQISYLQLYSSKGALDSFFSNTLYLLAFVLGHTLFSFLACYLILKGNEKVCSLTGSPLPKSARQINKILLVVITTLAFSSFPYYGLDYLFTKTLGFLPEDPAYINTIFSPTQVRSRNRHFKSRAPATKDSKTPLELDLNYFDRAMYLNAPKREKMASDPYKAENTTSSLSEKEDVTAAYDPALSFESLNYRGESAWLMRHERARRLPEEQEQKKESVFQKPKTHFKELRSKQDSKQAEAALKEIPQIGSVAEWKEGSMLGEILPFYSEEPREERKDSLLSLGLEKAKQGSEDFQEEKKHGSGKKGYFIPQLNRAESEKDDTSRRGRDDEHKNPYLDKSGLLKLLSFEKEVAANYDSSFASPFGEESDGTPPDLLPVENIIKKRYRLNPVYRALLQTDIDSFLARQPAEYKITQNQEASLFKKRQLLEKYYNSIRYYAPVESVGFADLSEKYFADSNSVRSQPLSEKSNERSGSLKNEIEEFSGKKPYRSSLARTYVADRRTEQKSADSAHVLHRKINGENGTPFTKSFVETTYHQQFKGTLAIVKRFFKATLDIQQNPNKDRILSYDQPLYKNRFSSQKDEKKYHPSLHEELTLGNVLPFVEESNSAPIYAGWDDKARRFVLTNRFSFME